MEQRGPTGEMRTHGCGVSGWSPAMSQKERLIEQLMHSSEGAGAKTFGERNLGDAELGDAGRTKRMVHSPERIAAHTKPDRLNKKWVTANER